MRSLWMRKVLFTVMTEYLPRRPENIICLMRMAKRLQMIPLRMQDHSMVKVIFAVRIDGKWGFIDKDGKVVIKPEYVEARSFSNGFADSKTCYRMGIHK